MNDKSENIDYIYLCPLPLLLLWFLPCSLCCIVLRSHVSGFRRLFGFLTLWYLWTGGGDGAGVDWLGEGGGGADSPCSALIISGTGSEGLLRGVLGCSPGRGAWSWSPCPSTGSCEASSTVTGLGAGRLGPCAGLNALKNLRFLSVTLPLPSTFTEYLSNPLSSRTTPDLSHRLLALPNPLWFWIYTHWPGFSAGWCLVCSDHLSSPL